MASLSRFKTGQRFHLRSVAPRAPRRTRLLLAGSLCLVAGTAQADDLERDALVRRWAPNFAQQVSAAHPERDRPLSVDFDGDWDATNNWAHLTPERGAAQPVVYASAIETRTHAFLTYTLFYPRDWFSPVCVSYLCHDNDLEVALLVVRRAPEPERERIVYVETKAHLQYVAAPLAELALDSAGRPWIRVESEGHGMYPIRSGEPLPKDAQWFAAQPAADAPSGRGAPDCIYQLESLRETLWAQRAPGAAHGSLWASGETGFLGYTGARFGRRGGWLGALLAGQEYVGGVRPAWGLQARAGQRGDWFLDPAYVAALQHAQWFTLDPPNLQYVFNPYLEDLTRECVSSACPAIPPPPAPNRARFGLAGGLVLATGWVSLRARRRVVARWRRAWQRWYAR